VSAPLLAALALAAAGETVAVRAAELPPGGLADEFDLCWQLPERPASSPGLLPSLEALAAERFELRVDGVALRTFGDLALACEPLGAAERASWLQRLAAASPALAARHGQALRQLLLDEELRAPDWDADDDGRHDGFLMGAPWKLEGPLPPCWERLDVTPQIEQGAALVRSDLDTFKAVENDFRLYLGHRGADYEWIYPEPGRFFTGVDSSGRPVNTSLVVFRCDLPFPFTHYDCRLHVLNRLDGAGRLWTDIYSTSRDFHFLAGRDAFVPVRAGDGRAVGFLIVRDFGFDVDGVPDKARHRASALRRSLGNLKLEAERRTAGGALGALDGELPSFEMYGLRN